MKNLKKIGICLSGGGARGFAHLGALQALNEQQIFPDIVAGTSAGALAGALYADGHKPKEILKFFDDIDFMELIKFTVPQGGLFKSTGLVSYIQSTLKAKTFEELKLPLYTVATDLEHAQFKTFSSGPLIPAIVASCSVPIIFCPVEINGHHYVDGGLFKNLPASVIREKCKKLIGVNASPLTSIPYKNSLRYIAERSFHYTLASNTFFDSSLCDYMIQLNKLAEISLFKFDNIDRIYEIGYNATLEFLEKINIGILQNMK